MGAKSCPLAPKPWSQMTECVGVAPGGVVISMGARFAFGAGAGCMGFAWGFSVGGSISQFCFGAILLMGMENEK